MKCKKVLVKHIIQFGTSGYKYDWCLLVRAADTENLTLDGEATSFALYLVALRDLTCFTSLRNISGSFLISANGTLSEFPKST